MITTLLETYLKDIAFTLVRIAAALEQANKPKGLGNPFSTHSSINPIDCISKNDIPLSTPWTTDNTPSCEGDCICGKNKN
jgi:hypothetical protein